MAKHKADDVVLSKARVSGFDEKFGNQLCIVRAHDDDDDLYWCTLLATGEKVTLFGSEIVNEEQTDG